jgi:hypothetical protein
MKVVSVVKLTSTALIVIICSCAIGAEGAKQLAPLQNFPLVTPDKLPSSGPLKVIIDNLHQHATSDQYQLIVGAIGASPALIKQLTVLADSGLITELSIDTPLSRAPRPNIFNAGISGTNWVFTSIFLKEQGTARIYDVVSKDDILPNNMVFALGHLAFHAQTTAQYKKDEEALKRITDSSAVMAEAARTNVILPMKRSIDLRLRYEAGAIIQGWNDVYDAAVSENQGNQLNANQIGNLIFNLRNRAILLKTMDNTKLFSDNGRIDQTAANVSAIVSALHDSRMMDIE